MPTGGNTVNIETHP